MSIEPPAILAFGFASPWLLGGLALGAIPIVIHLLYKRRYRETPWAAMRFLIEAARKQSRRIRLERLLLLALRVILLMLLALALARPYFESLGTHLAADAPAHKILVVDASFSMGHKLGEQSRFDSARQIARDVVTNGGQGDAFNLVRICGSPPQTIIQRPSYRREPVLAEIDGLELTDEAGDVSAALREVAELLDEAAELRQKQVFLISDFQRASWWTNSAEARAPIRKLLTRLADAAELILIDLGQPRTANVAVTRFAAEQPFVIVGEAVPLRVTAANFGESPLNRQVLELYIDGKLAETRRIDFRPQSETQADFSYTFTSAGEHRLEARLESDALDIDNRRYLALPVKAELNVLLVNGRPSGTSPQDATHYLETVLSPSTSREPAPGTIQPHVIKEGELVSTDLSRYECVFLCDVALLTEREAEILKAYVNSGGGLVVCLGAQVRPDNYNLVLSDRGEALLPGRLGNRVGNAQEPQRAFEFDTADLSHRIVNPFEGNPGAGLETALTFEYFKIELSEQQIARVVLQFTTGDPAIVESPFGRGRVVLVATSADVTWGTWPIQKSFPPIVHEMVQYVVAGRWADRQLSVGQPLRIAPAANSLIAPVSVVRPDGREESVHWSSSSERPSLSYLATDRSGMYDVTYTGPLASRQIFAVNLEPRECDLAKVSEMEIEGDLLAGARFLYRTDWRDRQPEAQPVQADRGGLSPWLLAAALCLLFVEQTMAWNFGYGFLLLYVVVAAGFAQLAFGWHIGAGMGVLLLFSAGVALAIFLRLQRSGRRRTPSLPGKPQMP